MSKQSESNRTFKLKCGYLRKVEKLSDEGAGQLFKAILSYVNAPEEVPEIQDTLADMVFVDIKDQLDYDLKCRARRLEACRKNGALGGRPSKKAEAGEKEKDETEKSQSETKNNQIGFSDNQIGFSEATEKPKKIKKVVNAIDYSSEFSALWDEWPRKESKAESFRNYNRLIKKGYLPEDLKTAVDNYLQECRREGKPTRYIFKMRTFLDKDGEFQRYMQKNWEDPEEKKSKPEDEYKEVNFRDYM